MLVLSYELMLPPLFLYPMSNKIDLFSNTVDVHIRYLRKKIDDSYSKKLIKTVKGVGYMLISDDI